ncbi:Methyltransferase domain-containing protein [Ruminococcaceae bacterium YRB3002]|nr:Methyltransferase domain-containing protein [Ruminococcaceae bacterium YRB3002]
MRSRAERYVQQRNALTASAFSLLFAGFVTLVSECLFELDLLTVLMIIVVTFTIILALLIFLWKKTDILRKLQYALYCAHNHRNSREYYCPCCNRRLVSFTDMKFYDDNERYDPDRFRDQRQDVMCPFCYSAPRQRILASWANDNIDLIRNSRILFFAPEYSMMKWFRRNKIRPETADLNDTNADLKLDLTDISLPDGSYDMVICNHVIEHVSSYEKALSELNRILVPNGKLIISFPIDHNLDTVFEHEARTPEDRIRLFGQYDHLRVFGKDSNTLIGSFGFDVDVIDVKKMSGAILPVAGPADYDSNVIYYCVKISR